MNPDELLQQIRALLEEYLAMGEDTPVAAEAQALAAAIDGGGEEVAPPDMEPPPAEEAPLEKPKDFAGARGMALEDMETGGPAMQAAEANMAAKKKRRGQGY